MWISLASKFENKKIIINAGTKARWSWNYVEPKNVSGISKENFYKPRLLPALITSDVSNASSLYHKRVNGMIK